jgi:hypothetical protein
MGFHGHYSVQIEIPMPGELCIPVDAVAFGLPLNEISTIEQNQLITALQNDVSLP